MSIIAEENKAGKITDGDMKQMITHNFCLPFSLISIIRSTHLLRFCSGQYMRIIYEIDIVRKYFSIQTERYQFFQSSHRNMLTSYS
jgi:hypothetical protein